MRKLSMVAVLMLGGCLGGGNDTGNSQLSQQTGEGDDTGGGGMDPGVPTDPVPGDPGDDYCLQLKEEIGLCYERVQPLCEAAYDALNTCYQDYSAACRPLEEALIACYDANGGGQMDRPVPGEDVCQAEADAVRACYEGLGAPSCEAEEVAAQACDDECEARLPELEMCFPPEPPPPVGGTCELLHQALAACQVEFGECQPVEPQGREDGMEPPVACTSRCESIERAIAELCPTDPPCDQPPQPGDGMDPSDPGDPTDPDRPQGG